MVSVSDLLAQYPAAVEVDADRVARETNGDAVLVVLDDDPTGTQSVAGLPVLTAWETSDFEWAFAQRSRAIYILTNTRSLDPATAEERTRRVVSAASAAADGRSIVFVSRSDSTLRGHFPLETDVIADASVRPPDAVALVPAFPDAGRITIGGVHYVRDGDALLPVSDTEFANDATFGFAHSDLAEWVEEKTVGRWTADRVIRLDLGVIRRGPAAIADVLMPLEKAVPVVVDAVDEHDLRMLALGLDRAERAGKSFLYRVGPPFVRARIGQAVRAPLTAADVYGAEGSDAVGGLIVVGSHVGVTSRQLAELERRGRLAATLEIEIDAVLDPERVDDHLCEIAGRAADALERGDVVVHTSRELRSADDAGESLDIARGVSAAVVVVVQQVLVAHAPRFVIAKGGITSSDVASKGLGIRHAVVRGPMLPGIVSLWEPVDGPAKGIPFVVFAGNVGDDDSLAAVVETMRHPQDSDESRAE